MGMAMTTRILLALTAIVLAAIIPMIAAGAGATIFWAQTIGIVTGWLLLYFAIVPRQTNKKKAAVSLFAAAAVATLIVVVLGRAW
jgi:hypothetical protein